MNNITKSIMDLKEDDFNYTKGNFPLIRFDYYGSSFFVSSHFLTEFIKNHTIKPILIQSDIHTIQLSEFSESQLLELKMILLSIPNGF